MLTYLCETHFWTTDEDITIKHTDLGAFRYESKKSSANSVYISGKRDYVEKRGGRWSVGGWGLRRLRPALRDLEELLRSQPCLSCSWLPPLPLPLPSHQPLSWLSLLFSTGIIVYVAVNPATGDILKILFDRYLVGKLLSANVSEVLFTSTHILLVYPDNQAILVSFNRPSIKSTAPEKLSNRDPKFQTVELGVSGVWGAGGRGGGSGGGGGVSASAGGGAILLWRRASPSDLFPWSPHNDQDNVHIYSLAGSQMSLLCYHRIEFDPLCVSFSTIHDDIIFSVEQKTSKKGGVVVEWRRLRVSVSGCCGVGSVVRLAAPAPATCAARSPCETRLLLACSDRSLLLHHTAHNVTTTVTAAFVARVCSWWSGGVVVGGGGAQLQAWDTALAPTRLALPSDHAPPDTFLDLTSYFKKEPSLSNLSWNSQSGEKGGGGGCTLPSFTVGDGLLLLVLRGGPLVCLRIFSTATPQEDPGIVRRGQELGALARLRAMDWATEGTRCLALLHQLINTLFSVPLTPEREQVAQAALGTFLAPPTPLPPATRLTHAPHLHDLCRRFFHLLIRYKRFDKALCLAIDVGHQDLFMDVQYAAQAAGQVTLAQEAMQHAKDAASSCDSSCSRVSCSRCSSSSDSGSECGGDRPLDLYGGPCHSPSPGLPPPPLPPPPLRQQSRPPPPLPHLTSADTHKGQRMMTHTQVFKDNVVDGALGMEWPRISLLPLQSQPPPYSPVYPSRLLHPPQLPSAHSSISTISSRLDYLPAPSPIRHDFFAPIPTNRFKSRGDFLLPSIQSDMLDHSVGGSRAVPQVGVERKVPPTPVIKPPPEESQAAAVKPPEKNKVKFSDTVTVAVVPEIPRKDRRGVRGRGRGGGGGGGAVGAPDWRRELADSLPLCHPHHDYLKDFTPHPENEEQEKTSKIKVVHFGVV